MHTRDIKKVVLLCHFHAIAPNIGCVFRCLQVSFVREFPRTTETTSMETFFAHGST